MRILVVLALLAIAGSREVGTQDAPSGEKVFGICKALLQIGEGAQNALGPIPNGVVGRSAGSVPGYPVGLPGPVGAQ